MNTFFQMVFFCSIFFCVSCTQSSNLKKISSLPKHKTNQTIENIINNTDKNANIGIKIIDLASGSILYSKNNDRLFTPASTIKLATLASALHYLGPSYRFTTEVFTDGFIKNVQTKNLYLKGSGDPSLMETDLNQLALEIAARGVKEIKGDIYVDDFIFDNEMWPNGSSWEDRDRGYAAPVSGLNINYNRLVLKTYPAFQPGLDAKVVLLPKTKAFVLESQVKTRPNNTSRLISLELIKKSSDIEGKDGLKLGDKIILRGQTALNADPHYSLVALHDPALLAGEIFKERLIAAGIKCSAQVKRSKTSENAIRLSSIESRSLSEALVDFTKISNNLGNDVLLKAIAAQNGVKPASFAAGLSLVKQFLKNEIGIDTNNLTTADGSGLSRYNLMSPNQLVQILSYSANKFNFGPEFLTAMPFLGVDGNLRARLNDDALKGSVRAKGGTMGGISCLAGFATSNDNRRLAFAVMINGISGNVQKYQKLTEDILASFIKPIRDQEISKK